MNSKERIYSVLSGNRPDQPPVSLTLSLYGLRYMQTNIQDYYSNPKIYAEGQLKVYNDIKQDVIFSPFALPLYGQIFNAQLHWLKNSAPNLKKPAYKNISDCKKLRLPDLNKQKELVYLNNSINYIKDKTGDEVLLAGIMLSPVDMPVMIFGMDLWLEIFLFHTEIYENILIIMHEFSEHIQNMFHKAGTDVLIMPGAFNNSSILSREMIQDKIVQEWHKMLSYSKVPVIMHSTGIEMNPYIDLFNNFSGIIGYVPDSMDDLVESRNLVGSNKVIIGNLNGAEINMNSPEQILKQASGINDIIQKDSLMIFGSSAADIPLETNPELLKEIVSLVREDKNGN